MNLKHLPVGKLIKFNLLTELTTIDHLVKVSFLCCISPLLVGTLLLTAVVLTTLSLFPINSASYLPCYYLAHLQLSLYSSSWTEPTWIPST
jgi:hypothetical protein